MIQSGHKFAHVMTAELSWHVQNLWPDLMIIFHAWAMHILTSFWFWAHQPFVKWIRSLIQKVIYREYVYPGLNELNALQCHKVIICLLNINRNSSLCIQGQLETVHAYFTKYPPIIQHADMHAFKWDSQMHHLTPHSNPESPSNDSTPL